MEIINDVQVKPIKQANKITKPLKHQKLFPDNPYPTVYLCAKRKSGKSSAITTILKESIGRDTSVYAFCSTLDVDPVWVTIKKWLHKKGTPFYGYHSLKDDDGSNILDGLMKEWEDEYAEDDTEEDEDQKPKVERPQRRMAFDGDEVDEEKKLKPTKYQAVDKIVICDDLSTELRSVEINKLLKQGRHYHAMILLSSQHVNDLKPEGIRQLEYAILFRGHSEDKLKKIYELLDLNVGFERFLRLYKHATKTIKFGFLYIDVKDEEYRQCFNKKYDLIKLFGQTE